MSHTHSTSQSNSVLQRISGKNQRRPIRGVMADIVAIYYNGQKSVIRDEWTRNVCRNVFQVERAQYNSSAMRSYAIAYRVPFVPQMIIDGDRIVTFFHRCTVHTHPWSGENRFFCPAARGN